MRWLSIAFLFATPLTASLLVSEVFARHLGGGSHAGYQWVEVYNAGEEPASLSGLVLSRLDGLKQKEAWRIELQNPPMAVLGAGEFLVLAQSPDLGLGMCLTVPVWVIKNSEFSIKTRGIQTLCVHRGVQMEDCTQFSTSVPFTEGHSRSRLLLNSQVDSEWGEESCGLKEGLFATPGQNRTVCEQEGHTAADVLKTCQEPALPEGNRGETGEALASWIPTFQQAEVRDGHLVGRLKEDPLGPYEINVFSEAEEGTRAFLSSEISVDGEGNFKVPLTLFDPGISKWVLEGCSMQGECQEATGKLEQVLSDSQMREEARCSIERIERKVSGAKEELYVAYTVSPLQRGHVHWVGKLKGSKQVPLMAASLLSEGGRAQLQVPKDATEGWGALGMEIDLENGGRVSCEKGLSFS